MVCLCMCLPLVTFAQMKQRFKYQIGKDSYPINYLVKDTTFCSVKQNGVKAIAQINIKEYVLNAKSNIIVDTIANETYPIISEKVPRLSLCSRKLVGDLIQKDDISGRVYISFWGIKSQTEPANCKPKDGMPAEYIHSGLKLGEFFYQISTQDSLNHIRQYISVPFSNSEIGIISIPFKYRFSYKKDSVHVPTESSSSLNLGAYFGFRWGVTRFYVDRTKTKNARQWVVGFFAAPTLLAVSSDNSFPTQDSILKKQIAAKPTQLGLSTGIAIVKSYGDLNIGLFAGTDIPLTKISRQWYYAYKPWIGFGVGYKLAMLGEK